ncbi:hypothetical protein QJS66_12430 [Kocuria rhizophila]|nr:hypothetical protein QJS66_12430 [Kocuria rhizophila]
MLALPGARTRGAFIASRLVIACPPPRGHRLPVNRRAGGGSRRPTRTQPGPAPRDRSHAASGLAPSARPGTGAERWPITAPTLVTRGPRQCARTAAAAGRSRARFMNIPGMGHQSGVVPRLLPGIDTWR